MYSDSTVTRRRFLRTASAGILGGAVFSGCAAIKKTSSVSTPIGIQLYTLRDLMRDDFKGTLKKVKGVGYDAVEFAGYGGYSATEVKEMLNDFGLVCAGTHEGFGRLNDSLDETIEFNAGIGNPNIVCPAMPGEWRKTGIDGFRRFGDRLNAIGEKVKEAGMRLCYHNHSFEFERDGGETLFDGLLGTADPSLVYLEVDVYWVKRGKVDPIRFIRKHGKRCAMLHMKDMANDAEQSFAPVGTGLIDMPGIIAAAREIDMKWFVVEQDRTKLPPLEAVAISQKNLRSLLKR